MKKTILSRLYLFILLSFICGMIAFMLGANAEPQSVKFNYILLMGFNEISIILSVIILFYLNTKKTNF